MLKYLAKRLLFFVPTLFAISLITFIISINAPGDPVESMLNKNSGDGQSSEKLAQSGDYKSLRHELGFDLPVFYFSISNASSCDTLYKIGNASQRAVLERMCFTHGNWKDVLHYYVALNGLESDL